jgi:hypothetical protein
MAEFFDISNWQEKPWFQTGGTRSKMIVENPDDHSDYYFKTSLKKINKDYKYEFWSEIIASEIGQLLGFNVLRYDIAYNGKELGCISKSMVIPGENKLTEGISYLTGYDTTYQPADKKSSKTQYTFQFIVKALRSFKLERFVENIIELIIFDSLIGNSDRHQENWGVLTKYNDVIKLLEELPKKKKRSGVEQLLYHLLSAASKFKKTDYNQVLTEIQLTESSGVFAPIYDSGSSLGREKEEEKIKQILKDSIMMEAFVRRGESEIHWEGEKLNHFELIKKINNEYPEIVSRVIKQVVAKYNTDKIRQIVLNIDNKVPQDITMNKLSEGRKEFIIKIISLRFEKLKEILQ